MGARGLGPLRGLVWRSSFLGRGREWIVTFLTKNASESLAVTELVAGGHPINLICHSLTFFCFFLRLWHCWW